MEKRQYWSVSHISTNLLNKNEPTLASMDNLVHKGFPRFDRLINIKGKTVPMIEAANQTVWPTVVPTADWMLQSWLPFNSTVSQLVTDTSVRHRSITPCKQIHQ